MENIIILFENSLSTNNQLRKAAEISIDQIILDESIIEIFFKFISKSNNIQRNIKMSFIIYVKNYLSDYINKDNDKALQNPKKIMTREAISKFQHDILLYISSNCIDISLLDHLCDCILSAYKSQTGYLNFWPDLALKLKLLLENRDLNISYYIYSLIANFTYRYTVEFRSDSLFMEILDCMQINEVMTNDALELIRIFVSSNYQNVDKRHVDIVKYIVTIAYNFNYQDFPEFYEDNLEKWISILKLTCGAVQYNPAFNDLSTTSMSMINKYFGSYYDDVRNYFNEFTDSLWSLLLNAKKYNDPGYYKLNTEILEFYKQIILYKRVNFDMDSINLLISQLILPHLEVSNKEIEDLEDKTEEFLKSELEDTEESSNKSMAISLLKSLNEVYPSIFNDIVKPAYISLLDEYDQDVKLNWRSKALAINIIFSSIIIRYSSEFGVSKICISNEELIELLNRIAISELNNTNQTQSRNSIIKAYVFKFLVYFRNLIPSNWLSQIVSLLANMLIKSESDLIIFGSLICIQKFLYMRNLSNLKEYPFKEILNNFSILNELFNVISAYSSNINQIAIKCLYKIYDLIDSSVFLTINDSIISINKTIIYKLITSSIQNLKPEFNFYFFESICLLLKKYIQTNINSYLSIRNIINDELHGFLNNWNEATEFQGYIFQIYSLELFIDNEFTDIQKSWLVYILKEENWVMSNSHLFDSFIQYIKVLMKINKSVFLSNNNTYFNSFLNIIRILIDFNRENLVFDIVACLVDYFEVNDVIYQLNQIVSLFLVKERLLNESNSKLYKDFKRNFLILLSRMLLKYGLNNIVVCFNNDLLYTISLFQSFFPSIIDIEDFRDKRFVNYAYCQLLYYIYGKVSQEYVVNLIKCIISSQERFYKYPNYYVSKEKPADFNDEYTFIQSFSHVLSQAKIDFNDDPYVDIKKSNECKVFIDCFESLKINIDCLVDDREKVVLYKIKERAISN